MQRPLTHKISVLGNNVLIKQILPSDFLDGDFPISFFKVVGTQVKTMAEITRENAGVGSNSTNTALSGSELETLCRRIMGAGVVSLNGRPFNFEEFIRTETNAQKMFFITNEVIRFSSQLFEKTKMMTQSIRISKNIAVSIDKIAKRYGKTPAEIAFSELTGLDAYIFNLTIGQAAITEEVQFVNSKKIALTYGV